MRLLRPPPRRALLLLVLVAGLAPGTWLRTPEGANPWDLRQLVAMDPLPITEPDLGEFEAVGAWHLTSPNSMFGGYSSLVPLGGGRLLAVTDGARMLAFNPRAAGGMPVTIDHFGTIGEGSKSHFDIEALARDPARGILWAAYENWNQIVRYDADLTQTGIVRPAAMADWPGNGGPEALVRLSDGRFIVLGEDSLRWFGTTRPGLLFASDPVEGVTPIEFEFAPPSGYSPVDMAQMPDGRVLILLRRIRWGWPPGFSGKLLLADPDAIEDGGQWTGVEVADLAAPLPTDNYEGLALEPDGADGVTAWLISDDNQSNFQRTLLLELAWRPGARGS